MDICAVVLCGGKSTRMGTNKSLLKINEEKVIDQISKELTKITDNVILIANEPEPYEYLNLPIYQDRYENSGPLAGIESAMYHVEADTFLFAACDMPFINKDVYNVLLPLMRAVDAVVPKYNGRVHPLAALYKRDCLPIIQAKLNEKDFRVRSFYEEIHVTYVTSYPKLEHSVVEKHFFNMNNPSQYEKAKKLANKDNII